MRLSSELHINSAQFVVLMTYYVFKANLQTYTRNFFPPSCRNCKSLNTQNNYISGGFTAAHSKLYLKYENIHYLSYNSWFLWRAKICNRWFPRVCRINGAIIHIRYVSKLFSIWQANHRATVTKIKGFLWTILRIVIYYDGLLVLPLKIGTINPIRASIYTRAK